MASFHLVRVDPVSVLFSQEEETWQELAVKGNVAWTDTGHDVEEGEEITFVASGSISLQKGNPDASCGPDGYNLKFIQQPIPDENLGSLIGKVARLLFVEKDKETGEEIRHELVELFFIGEKNTVKMPMSGRLFLGINESIVGDNEGEYIVRYSRTQIPL